QLQLDRVFNRSDFTGASKKAGVPSRRATATEALAAQNQLERTVSRERCVLHREHNIEERKFATGTEAGIHPSIQRNQNQSRIRIVAQIDRKIIWSKMEFLQLADTRAPQLASQRGVALPLARFIKQVGAVDLIEDA